MLFFQTMFSPQAAGSLKAGVELDLFTAIDEGATTVGQLTERCQTSARGMRILCDYLTVLGFLRKDGMTYALTPDSAMFLSRRSPACLGSAVEFLGAPQQFNLARDVAGAVRRGGTMLPGDGPLEANFPLWVTFARAMAPMMHMPAEGIGTLLGIEAAGPVQVLDIAAGHGMFGIALARRNPQARVTAVDWEPVLEVARENATAAGVSDRYHSIPGSAFDVELGTGYDVVLLPNFLHHFNHDTNVGLLRRVHAALKPGGKVVVAEFVPNEDRVTPPMAAQFSMVMLLSTPAGDAYTMAELSGMLTEAGFAAPALHPLPGSPNSVVLAHKV